MRPQCIEVGKMWQNTTLRSGGPSATRCRLRVQHQGRRDDLGGQPRRAAPAGRICATQAANRGSRSANCPCAHTLRRPVVVHWAAMARTAAVRGPPGCPSRSAAAPPEAHSPTIRSAGTEHLGQHGLQVPAVLAIPAALGIAIAAFGRPAAAKAAHGVRPGRQRGAQHHPRIGRADRGVAKALDPLPLGLALRAGGAGCRPCAGARAAPPGRGVDHCDPARRAGLGPVGRLLGRSSRADPSATMSARASPAHRTGYGPALEAAPCVLPLTVPPPPPATTCPALCVPRAAPPRCAVPPVAPCADWPCPLCVRLSQSRGAPSVSRCFAPHSHVCIMHVCAPVRT
jgi:hypothetical protein